jgi:hypothetical protein
MQGELADICHMAKAVKTKHTGAWMKRSAHSGQFIGRTKDGILIPRPDFKPESFTLSELDRAIRAVKRRRAETQAG